MLRVHRFAAAIAMMAAGTSAPMPMAANATPAKIGPNCWLNSTGMTVLPSARPVAPLVIGLTPAAMATYPSSASRPRNSQDPERHDQREVPGRPGAVEPHGPQYGFQPDELQRDVGHRRDAPGERDDQRKQRALVAPAHEVGRGDVAVHPRHRPHPQDRQE